MYWGFWFSLRTCVSVTKMHLLPPSHQTFKLSCKLYRGSNSKGPNQLSLINGTAKPMPRTILQLQKKVALLLTKKAKCLSQHCLLSGHSTSSHHSTAPYPALISSQHLSLVEIISVCLLIFSVSPWYFKLHENRDLSLPCIHSLDGSMLNKNLSNDHNYPGNLL